jgi:hypothetical protein
MRVKIGAAAHYTGFRYQMRHNDPKNYLEAALALLNTFRRLNWFENCLPTQFVLKFCLILKAGGQAMQRKHYAIFYVVRIS